MRPTRLELSGFAAFREPEVIDFAGADLFVLTGPTGSGKSTVLDAITFALYGVVPRHGKGVVGAAVTQGRQEARVRLDFTVGGEAYTAVRIVRRTGPARATTREARLERGDVMLAGSAGEVTEQVEQLLGLAYDQFVKSVVLPQGEFQRFLHDKPADRQDLLVRLLELGVYEQVAQLARQRAAGAEGRLGEVDARRVALGDTTPETLAAAARRVEALEEALEAVSAAAPRLRKLEEDERELSAETRRLRSLLAQLDSIRHPAGFERLARDLAAAGGGLAEARELVTARTNAAAEARAALARQPPAAELRLLLERHQQLEQARVALADASAIHEEAAAAAAGAAEQVEHARWALEEAERRRDSLRHDHAAAGLAATLVGGEPCPVCRQPVTEVPAPRDVAGLAEAEKDHRRCVRKLEKAQARRRAAEQELAGAGARLDGHRSRVGELERQLAGAPPPPQVEASLRARLDAEAGLARLDAQVDEAAAGVSRAEATLSELAGAERSARLAYRQARDLVVVLDPPQPGEDDLAADWEALVSWCAETRPQLADQEAKAAGEAAELLRLRTDVEEGLAERAAAAGLELGGRPVRDAVVDGLSRARSESERLAAAAEEAVRLAAEHTTLVEAVRVGNELARQLGARNFETWVLEEALELLVIGANERLRDLSGGQYSLALNDARSFDVVDHRSADERRSVRTLSGGETFLVALALALSLADHLAAVSATGTVRLESIFLDEGFGTLDPEALEMVAGVIHEIGAGGKTIGLVTHVKELAEMVPVRFVVAKGDRTARVERVDT